LREAAARLTNLKGCCVSKHCWHAHVIYHASYVVGRACVTVAARIFLQNQCMVLCQVLPYVVCVGGPPGGVQVDPFRFVISCIAAEVADILSSCAFVELEMPHTMWGAGCSLLLLLST
jgi:hypothetical protein